jgi:hypothetical protein
VVGATSSNLILGTLIMRTSAHIGLLAIAFAWLTAVATAQNPFGFGQQNQNGLQGNAFAGNGVVGGPIGVNNAGAGALGGAALADFDSLIDLVISTVQPDTWIENGGGLSDIRPFPNGVWVDPAGVLQQTSVEAPLSLDVVPALPTGEPASGDPRRAARLRVVSLTRLEQEIARRCRADQPLDESMLTLAGLRRVQYVFVYPPQAAGEPGDVAVAGPAGDWKVVDGRIVAADTGRAVVRLDDLLELWRRELAQPGRAFGCSITPRQQNLADTHAFLAAESGKPLAPGRRDQFVEKFRTALGRQDIELFGIEGTTHAVQVLVEADYHMKRIGIGLEPAVAGVDSYLKAIRGREQPDSNILRWWFATNYEGVAQNEQQTAFELRGPGVRVLSENEMTNARGERIHTHVADEPTSQFAHQFTNHFDALAARYPVYGELSNLFDLAVALAIVRTHDLPATVGWTPTLFAQPKVLGLPSYRVPREVDSIVNHASTGKNRFTVVASGGVWIDTAGVLNAGERVAASSDLDYTRRDVPAELEQGAWWWDAEE